MTEHKPVMLSAGPREGAAVSLSQHVPDSGWYSDRIGECIDWGWFDRQFPQRVHELLDVDLLALSPFLPTFHRPDWPHPRFWSRHWQDLVSAVMGDASFRSRFARDIPPMPPHETFYYDWRFREGNRYLNHLMTTPVTASLAGPGAPPVSPDRAGGDAIADDDRPRAGRGATDRPVL